MARGTSAKRHVDGVTTCISNGHVHVLSLRKRKGVPSQCTKMSKDGPTDVHLAKQPFDWMYICMPDGPSKVPYPPAIEREKAKAGLWSLQAVPWQIIREIRTRN
eukprot:scaffold625_cov324-Pavlova_lutheri.AAC.135